MTQNQQTALQSFKDTGKLPKGLENIFIEDCLRELAEKEESRRGFNHILRKKENMWFSGGLLIDKSSQSAYKLSDLSKGYKEIIILTLLSRTPDGQAVMPFLNVENKEYKFFTGGQTDEELHSRGIRMDLKIRLDYIPKTLQALLLQEFTQVCFNQGLGFDEALKAVNLEYIKQIYL